MIIIPKETLEELGNPQFVQFGTDGVNILLYFSDTPVKLGARINYPLKKNSFALHIRDERFTTELRKRYQWGPYLYSVDAEVESNVAALVLSIARKTGMSNKGC